MHAKIINEIIHATWYMQEKPNAIVDLDVFLHFTSSSFAFLLQNPNYAKLLQECSRETLSVQEYEKE